MIRHMTMVNKDLPGVTVGILTDAEHDAIQMTYSLAGFVSYNLPRGTLYVGPVVQGKMSAIAVVLDEPEPSTVRCGGCRRTARSNDPLHEVDFNGFGIYFCGDCCNRYRQHIRSTLTPNAVVV